MINFKVWISSFRLRTLPLSISGIILGSALAYSNQFFNTTIFVFALLTTISLQILSNLANDYGDGVKGTDNNNRIGPERAIQSGLISPQQMKHAIIINVLVLIVLITTLLYFSFGTNEYLNLLVFFLLGIVSIFSAIKYTVGNKAYGYYALGDLFVLLFFGFLSVMGSYYLYAKGLEINIIFPSLSIGLLSVAVINLNNMRDLVSDKLSNKITIAGKLGFNNNRIGPERAIQSGLISPQQMKYAIIINVLVLIVLITTLLYFSFGTNEYLNFLVFFLLGIVSIFSAIKYTVGNKAYGYYALGDLFVLLFFGFLSVMGSYYLYAKDLEINIILPSFSVGLLSVAVINLNNMRDLVSDKLSNKITIAGKLGFNNSKKYHFLILISSIIFSILFILFFYYKPIRLV